MLQEFLEKHQIKPQKIAVGVSGGADSLFAVLKTNEELAPLGFHVIALTVNHGLRKSAQEEADFVHALMAKSGIEHHTLVWQGNKPKTGVEEAARLARYDLIEEFCKTHEVYYFITAHHLLDQVETFFMRLERGSGLDGLCGMKEVTPFKAICILRPFLRENPDVFKAYLKKKNITWVEDESNNDESLLRVKIRHFLPLFEEKTGIGLEKIGQTMEKLQASRKYFEDRVQHLIKNNFKRFSDKVFCCSCRFFAECDAEIQYRLLCFLLKNIADTPYPPEAEKLLALQSKIKNEVFKSATLGHCRIIRQNEAVWFLPEIKTTTAYSKEIWKKYIDEHPFYQKMKLPLAVKRFLVENQNENRI